MEIASARDWIIVIVGVLEILFLLGMIVALIIVYNKINQLIKKGKETIRRVEESINKVEKTVSSPYFKVGAWLFRTIAAALGGSRKKKNKED